jgi:prolyl-tRNA editing enzyme YbaK/EbsC (Cys-tRNA(Pro) deacylase)
LAAVPASADVGPKPTVNFIFVYQGSLVGIIGGQQIECQDARRSKEKEFADLFPDCDTGAMPPFGNLYNVPVYVVKSLTEDREIVFIPGTHDETMNVRYDDYAPLAHPIVADFAVHL